MDQERLVSCLHSLLCKETFPHFFSSYPPFYSGEHSPHSPCSWIRRFSQPLISLKHANLVMND